MRQLLQITETSLRIAFQELRSNKLRTILSLSGVTIGIFCIVAVFTVLDSMEQNIRNNVASLGSNVLYIGKWPWMDDNGEYKWWEYWRRPVMTTREMQAVEQKSQTAGIVTLMYRENGLTLAHSGQEISGVSGYAVTQNFEKIQNFDLSEGRYLNANELTGGNFKVVLGHSVYENLFPNQKDFANEHISFLGHKFLVIGVLKKSGSNMAGFDFDNGIIYPYFAEANIKNVTGLNAQSSLMVKGKDGIPTDELSSEVEGILRAVRKVAPGEPNNFAINRLSQVTERLDMVFAMINLVGSIIAFFSLLVGGFGIANIMFVTVKERTKIIGLKKAIGARSSSILSEFLIEAIILCLLGGLAGILIVFALGFILSHAFDFPVILSFKNFLIGIGISSFVGLISGFIPARAAARLHPVAAIRST